jgi:hypothetical protein
LFHFYILRGMYLSRSRGILIFTHSRSSIKVFSQHSFSHIFLQKKSNISTSDFYNLLRLLNASSTLALEVTVEWRLIFTVALGQLSPPPPPPLSQAAAGGRQPHRDTRGKFDIFPSYYTLFCFLVCIKRRTTERSKI